MKRRLGVENFEKVLKNLGMSIDEISKKIIRMV